MTPLVGISSSSIPHASATQLLRHATAIGARCLDLRVGRGQGWEPQLELIASTLPVSFLGTGATLGDGRGGALVPDRLMPVVIERRIVLRLFVGPLDDAQRVRRVAADIDRLRDTWGPGLRLAVEPHAAAPTLGRLDELLAQYRLGAVVDTLGLVRLGARLSEARAFLRRHAIAVQVKGLVLRDGAYRHVALGLVPQVAAWTAALVGDVGVPVTVETRAGTAAQDIRTLLEAITRPGRTSAVPERLEVPQCVSAC